MKLFTAIYDDARLLGHFLRHYGKYGVTEFFIAAAHGFASIVNKFMNDYRITLFEGLDTADSFLGGTAAVTEMRRIHQQDHEWVVIVDLDEFVEFVPDVHHFLSIAESDNANVVRGIMYDRFSADGKLVDIDEETDLPKLFPVRARFIEKVMQGCDHKGVLVRGQLKAVGAHHIFEGEKLCFEVLEIAHYKWISGSMDRVKSAIQLVPWHVEYERVLDHWERFGRFASETFGGWPCRGA
jgi:hypothetical protein